MSTHEDRLAAALTAADEAYEAAQAQAGAAHAAIAEKSAQALQVATDTYDAAMSEAGRVLAGKAERAATTRARAEEQAWTEFDAAMREQYGEPTAEVVQNAAGSLELRQGRLRLGGVVMVGTDSYRVDGPAGMTFVSDPVKARAMLWAALAEDEPAVA